MTYQQLVQHIQQKKSFLCVGLDTDIKKIPPHMVRQNHAIFEFNKAIVDATAAYTVAYKPNIAFYEAHGLKGWENLEMTVSYIRSKYPDIFLIADAKRGDIGNTSGMYARAFFEEMDFDAVTVAPYMGSDSIQPFLEFTGKWVVVLALTSNNGAADFQYFSNTRNKYLYQEVIAKAAEWGNKDNMMFVVGATKAQYLQDVRQIIPDHFLLVPGVGAQGGSLQEVAKYGLNKSTGLLVNSSRGILYAGSGEDFAEKAKSNARILQQEMARLLPD
ncbi:MAG: orotidine-5'-phosphate decarboxylase [Bacteroidetes bacterium]|jgi:orotidine-5'-phosphate decarboxylase|nr:orotidine-5'-phosphate decarboxylase [Bacteroidota bacterium]